MDLFADIVEKQVGSNTFINSSGECSFEKTFGKVNRMRTLLNLFNEIEAVAENLFVYPRVNGDSVIIKDKVFTIKQDGYSEMSEEANLINLCESIISVASAE